MLLLAPVGAEPAGRIAPAPVQGEPLPADGQVQLTLNGRSYTWSGAQLRAVHGELRTDQTILLGILQGLLEKDETGKTPEFTPVLDFKKAGTASGPTERGGPPAEGDVKTGSFGGRP